MKRHSDQRSGARVSPVCAIVVGLLSGACANEHALRVEPVDGPAPEGSVVPQATALENGDLVLSWQEPRPDQGYRFRAAVRSRGVWGEPSTIDDSPQMSMYSANLPGIAEFRGGVLLAYWELSDTREEYATTIQLARSEDRGRSWTRLPTPHPDGTSGQHSFIAPFHAGLDLGLVWLDAGRRHHVPASADGDATTEGAIGLRYASFGPDGGERAAAFIDDIACECCPTAAIATPRGPVVVYRDRATPAGTKPENVTQDSGTVRDITVTRLEDGAWTKPHLVHADGWVVNACPDNGPAIDAIGNRLAVAWWTAPEDEARVSVAFSPDAGDTFGPSILVDGAQPDGQVTVALIEGGSAAIVGWLEGGKTWARWVGDDGELGRPLTLGAAAHHSRLPRWIARDDGRVLATWTEENEAGVRRVRMALLRPWIR
jgi:hypothetical protein